MERHDAHPLSARTTRTSPRSGLVLVVDDDPDDLARSCSALGASFLVLVATCGADGWRMAREALPDVIVLDVMLPGRMDGFSLFRKFHEDEALSHVPVIMVTSVNHTTGLPFSKDSVGTYLGAEPVAYMDKPVDVAMLQARVGELVAAIPGVKL